MSDRRYQSLRESAVELLTLIDWCNTVVDVSYSLGRQKTESFVSWMIDQVRDKEKACLEARLEALKEAASLDWTPPSSLQDLIEDTESTLAAWEKIDKLTGGYDAGEEDG